MCKTCSDAYKKMQSLKPATEAKPKTISEWRLEHESVSRKKQHRKERKTFKEFQALIQKQMEEARQRSVSEYHEMNGTNSAGEESEEIANKKVRADPLYRPDECRNKCGTKFGIGDRVSFRSTKGLLCVGFVTSLPFTNDTNVKRQSVLVDSMKIPNEKRTLVDIDYFEPSESWTVDVSCESLCEE